jgi:hypothetical protein
LLVAYDYVVDYDYDYVEYRSLLVGCVVQPIRFCAYSAFAVSVPIVTACHHHQLYGTRFTGRYTRRVAGQQRDVYVVNEVRAWIDGLDAVTHARVVQAIDALAEAGPGLGRPLADTISGSSIPNLKELRPGTVRILFCFDPWRSSILLVAGDKSGRWNAWYREAIPLAEQRYEVYLKERGEEEGGPR